MTSAGTVTVDVAGRDVNLVALLTRLEGQMRRTDQLGIRLSQTTGGTFTAAQTRAANSAITEAQALARAAVAAGDDARAHSILVSALGQSAAASDRSVASLTTSITRLQSGTTAFTQFGDAAKSSLLGIVGPAALLAGGIGVLKGTVDSFVAAFKFKAELDATTASINAQLRGVRDTGQVYAEAARFARTYKITQQETTEAIAASIGVMRNSKAGVEDILSVLARLQVLSPEQSLQEAAVAVKALASGDTTSLVTRFEVGRDVAGQMKKEIAGGADAVQVLNKFLNDTGIGMDALKAKTVGAAGGIKDAAIAQEQLTIAQAKLAESAGALAILEARTKVTQGATAALSGEFGVVSQALDQFAANGGIAGNVMALLTGQTQAAAQASTNMTATGQSAAASLAAVAFAARDDAIAMTSAGTITEAHSRAVANNTNTTALNSQAMASRAQLTQAATAALDQDAVAMAASTQKTLDAQLASQQLAQMQSTLASLGGAVAQGFQTAGAAALQLANMYGIARDQALLLINAQAQLAQAKMNAQAFSDQRVGERSGGLFSSVNQLKVYTEGQRNLARLEEATAKRRARGGGGGGGGGVKLTDQQKLNNTLLADQAKADDRSENLETQHQQRLLDIDREYQKKQLAAQQANELSKRSSEIDFLKALTSSELNTTKAGRAELARIDAQYYADFDAAQKAAQAGNAAQSEEMVKQAKQRADVELEYAQAIDKAQQEKDRGEVARLEALREKERQLLAEQSKQIIAGGDPNAVARDAALAAEQRSYEEQQGKIGTAAEQAAQRKIDAALRSGKAVTDENAQLREQEAILGRIGPRPAGVGGAPATIGAIPAAPPGAGAPVDLGALLGGLDNIAAAISAMQGAVVRAQDGTTSAVRNIKGAVMV